MSLTGLVQYRLGLLLGFEQEHGALNGKRQRANRLLGIDTAAPFVVPDFLEIVQPETTATVRIDAQSATLAGVATPSRVRIRPDAVFERF